MQVWCKTDGKVDVVGQRRGGAGPNDISYYMNTFRSGAMMSVSSLTGERPMLKTALAKGRVNSM